MTIRDPRGGTAFSARMGLELIWAWYRGIWQYALRYNGMSHHTLCEKVADYYNRRYAEQFGSVEVVVCGPDGWGVSLPDGTLYSFKCVDTVMPSGNTLSELELYKYEAAKHSPHSSPQFPTLDQNPGTFPEFGQRESA